MLNVNLVSTALLARALLLLLVVAGLILLLVHYWPWISLQLSNMRGPVLQPSVTPDFIGPRPPASGAGP